MKYTPDYALVLPHEFAFKISESMLSQTTVFLLVLVGQSKLHSKMILMSVLVCGKVHIKDPLLFIRNSSFPPKKRQNDHMFNVKWPMI